MYTVDMVTVEHRIIYRFQGPWSYKIFIERIMNSALDSFDDVRLI
jgi:hypothetical protein